MKKVIFYLVLIAAVFASFSCTKKENIDANSPAADVGPGFLPGVLLSNDMVKSTETEDGKMKYKASGKRGEFVKVFTVKTDAGEVAEKKIALRSDSQEREFYHVQADDGDFWVQAVFIAVDALPAVITGDSAVIYNKADLASPSPNVIPLYTIVGVHNAEAKGDFICVSAYETPGKASWIDKKFIKKDNITSDQRDIQVLQLYQTAIQSKTDVQKKEMLKNALGLGGVFEDLVLNALNELENAEIAFTTSLFPAEDNVYRIQTSSGIVNVRDNPGLHNTQVLFSLEDGEPVTPTSKTNEIDTINGSENFWYKVTVHSLGQSGWVFGEYLSTE